MKKLIRCSVTEESSLEFYFFIEEEMKHVEIEKSLKKYFEGTSIQDFRNMENDVRFDIGDISLDPKYALDSLEGNKRAAFHINEYGEADDLCAYDLKRLVGEMLEEREERERVEAFEKDQLALEESGL